MRLYLSVFFGLCLCPHAALAKTALETEVRSVETESTEIFTIFETLSNAQTALDRRDYILARRGFESVLLYDPELQPARSGLRRTLIALGDVSSATKLIDDPNSADAILIKTLSGSSTTPLKDLESVYKCIPIHGFGICSGAYKMEKASMHKLDKLMQWQV